VGDFGSINLDSKKPYYLQLKELIQGKIECRELLPNQKLPSEAELCKELKVSRTVIRQALVELEQEGLIRKRKGIGSFVAENKSKLMISLYPLDHLFLAESEEQITKLQLLKKTSLSAPAHTANVLMINDGDLVLQVLRLYCQREEPVILSRSLLPAVTVSNLTKVTKKREFLP
jgi:GntR family transcriptional regulator